MVVLTINAPSNDYTVYFDQPIPKPNYIRLLNCSLYNSWYNLKEEGNIYVYSEKGIPNATTIPPGHYTVDTISEKIQDSLIKTLLVRTSSPQDKMSITKKVENKISLSLNLAGFLGIGRELGYKVFIKKLNYPSTYFIHCDLIDKEANLFNGKPSSILANFEIKGKAFERVFYKSGPQHVLRDTTSDKFVRSLNISVRDENGELFDFNALPLTFVLEIN